MGLNVDLSHMLGIPNRTICPKCEVDVQLWLDDYDIECGNCNPEPGVWNLMAYCDECEHEWTMRWHLNPEQEEDDGS